MVDVGTKGFESRAIQVSSVRDGAVGGRAEAMRPGPLVQMIRIGTDLAVAVATSRTATHFGTGVC